MAIYSLYKAGKVFVSIILGAAASIGIFHGIIQNYLRAIAAKRWPKAEATILQSEVEILESYTGEPETAPEDCKYLVLEYGYDAGGKRYQSRKFNIFGAPRELTVDQMMAKYPKGAIVPVYYNPSNPVDCGLDCKLPKHFFRTTAIMIGIALALIAAAFWILRTEVIS